MRRPRALSALTVLAAVFAVAAISCSGKGNPASSLLPIDVVQAAPAKAAEAKTARFEMTMTVTGLPKGTPLKSKSTAEGQLDLASHRSQMTMDVMGMMKMEMVMDGDVGYMKTSPSLGDPKRPWIKVDPSEWLDRSKVQSGAGSLGADDPSQTLQWLRGVSGDVQVIGHEKIRGIETTHFRGTVNMTKAYEEMIAALKESAPAILKESLEQQKRVYGEEFVVDVWIDDDGLLRKMDYELGLGQDTAQLKDLKMRASLEMFDYGRPVSITIPKPDQVQSFADYLKQVGVGQ